MDPEEITMTETKLTKEYDVTQERLACEVKSGSLPVLATPAVAAFFEETAAALAQTYLGEGETTVGSKIAVVHLAPTLPGDRVTVTAQLMAQEGKIFRFQLEAYDAAGLAATATHERVTVNVERFMQKAEARKGSANE